MIGLGSDNNTYLDSPPSPHRPNVTPSHNLWRLPEVPLQDLEMTNMGARQCSSETVMIIHTFFRICHRNLLCLLFQPFLPTSKCRETRTPMMNDDVVFQVGEGEDKATMFSKCKMSLAKQVSFALLTNLDSVLAFGYRIRI